MKTTLLLTAFLTALFSTTLAFSATHKSEAPTPKLYSFQFKAPKSKAFFISQQAISKEQAYKLAARECFKKLTNNKYPGEEKGLEIIDICANPKM